MENITIRLGLTLLNNMVRDFVSSIHNDVSTMSAVANLQQLHRQ